MIKRQLSTYRILQCAAKYSSTCESKGFYVICFSTHYLSLTHKTTCTPSSTWCERFEALGWKCESVDILNFCLFVFLSLQTSWFQYQCKKVSLYFIIVYIVDCIYLHRRDTMVTGGVAPSACKGIASPYSNEIFCGIAGTVDGKCLNHLQLLSRRSGSAGMIALLLQLCLDSGMICPFLLEWLHLWLFLSLN